MLDREIASAMKFIIENAGGPAPYYYSVPQNFLVPAVYFPSPEVVTSGDTFNTYALEFMWPVKFFHKNVGEAYELGFKAITALQRARLLVPLLDDDGETATRGFRMKDPELRATDGAAQLTLIWDSRRPYYDETYDNTLVFDINLYAKAAYQSAVEQINQTEG